LTSCVSVVPAVRPRVDHGPVGRESLGAEATEVADAFGLVLDDWQSYVLERALVRRDDVNRWAAPEVGLVVPRQNGKGAVLEARVLYGLFALSENLIIWSAHEYKTAREAFLRIRNQIEGSSFMADVRAIRTAPGEESIETAWGSRLKFMARTGGSGRGFSGDCVILDEAYKLSGEQMAAMLPTLMARPDPQLWYTSMAGMEFSEQLERVRDRAVSGEERLCYLEWSAGAPDDHDGKTVDLDDRRQWQQANPALPHRISWDAIAQARAALSDEDFAREHLNLWGRRNAHPVIDPDVWARSSYEGRPSEDVAFAVDVPPERDKATVAVASNVRDGVHVELIEQRAGTDWVAKRVGELVKKWGPRAVMLDPAGPAGSLIVPLGNVGVEPQLVGGREMAQACGGFFDLVMSGQLKHLDDPVLNLAVDAGRRRRVGDAWAWHRRDTSADISPLVAVTLAVAGLGKPQPKVKSNRASFV